MLILMNHVRQPNDPLTENIIHFIKKKKIMKAHNRPSWPLYTPLIRLYGVNSLHAFNIDVVFTWLSGPDLKRSWEVTKWAHYNTGCDWGSFRQTLSTSTVPISCRVNSEGCNAQNIHLHTHTHLKHVLSTKLRRITEQCKKDIKMCLTSTTSKTTFNVQYGLTVH